jgi:hypothetical protein
METAATSEIQSCAFDRTPPEGSQRASADPDRRHWTRRCYVEMVFTQEVSTPVEITLWIGETKVSGSGEVVSKHPSFGNGLKFTKLSEEGKQALGSYLEALKPKGLMMQDSPIAGPPTLLK